MAKAIISTVSFFALATAFLSGQALGSDTPDSLTLSRAKSLLNTKSHAFKAEVTDWKEDKVDGFSDCYQDSRGNFKCRTENWRYYRAEVTKVYKGCCAPKWDDGDGSAIVVKYPYDDEESVDRPIAVDGKKIYFFANEGENWNGYATFEAVYGAHNHKVKEAEEGVQEYLTK